MKRFTFRLDRLLHLRSQEEVEKARLLGEAVSHEEAMRRAREEALAYLERCHEQASDTGVVMTTAGTLTNLNLAVRAAAERFSSAEADHVASAEDLSTAQEEFGEARRDRRIIERYREQRKEAYDTGLSRSEQQDIDEVARIRWTTRGDS